MKPFSLLIKPAGADCNLRCEYCFYLGKAELYPEARRPRMSEEVLERLVASYLATDQPVHAFGWQGGEPTLMGADFFRRVTGLQASLGRPGTTVSNGLQTNGLLVDDGLAAHLAQFRFLVGLSLDGPEEVHDRYRRNAAGKGSHAAALRAAGTLRKHDVSFNVLVLVTKANVRMGREVYRWLVDRGFLSHQYIPCVEFMPDGRAAPFSITAMEWGEFLCAVFDEWHPRDARRVSIRHFDAMAAKLMGRGEWLCTMGADCRRYFLVEHNGDVYPCDFFVEPGWKLGNVMENSWEEMLSSPRYAEFGARKSNRDRLCAACGHLDLCGGDCPRNRRPAPCGAGTRSWLCDGWRLFLDRARPAFEKLARE